MSPNANPDIEDLKVRLWKKLDTLPQRDAIEMSDAKQWINYMVHVMPSEAMWHMVRAGGVGGSEIGGLVRNFLGQRADHEFSAHDWALGKLLRMTPTKPISVMQRGHAMEPIHAERFYQEYNASRDALSYEKLSKAQGTAIWMRYSPDDIVLLKAPTQFETVDGNLTLDGRILLDYKAPTQVDDKSRIAFQYTCQLHQGAILCQEQGIELKGAMLSQFDWANWRLKNDYVEINDELCQLIRQSGDHYWDYVMRGQIPRYITRNRYELNPEKQKAYEQAAIRLGQLKAMSTELTNAAEDLRSKLNKGLGIDQARLDGQTIVFKGAIKVSATTSVDEDKVRKALGEKALEELAMEKPEVDRYSSEALEAVKEVLGEAAMANLMMKNKSTQYNTEALVEKLKELGQDVKPFRKMVRLDPVRVFETLDELGYDPEEFITESGRITVDREMKDRAKSWFSESFPALELPEGDEETILPTEAVVEPNREHERPTA